LVSEIDRIANNITFNGIKLLDGSFQNQSLQVGAGNEVADRIAISIGSAKVSALGIGSNSSYSKVLAVGAVVPTGVLAEGALSINNAQIGASVSDGVSYRNADGSAIAKASAINAASGLTGVTATVGKTTLNSTAVTAGNYTATAVGDVLINGVDIGIIGAATGAVDRGTQISAAINSKASQTGVTATADTSTGVVTLTAADGRNITISSTTDGGNKTGLKTDYATTVSATVGTVAAGGLVINGVSIGAVTAGADSTAQAALMVTAINLMTATTGVVASSAANSGIVKLTINSGEGRGIELSGARVADFGFVAGNSTKTATIQLSTQGSNGIVLGGSTGLTSTGQSAVGYNASVLTSSGGVDLSTAQGSQAALTVLDKAINTVTDSRASMGAYQNRLTASVASLETTTMNLQASRSRILDADYAKETTNLAKSQIIQQAATAMLAQANQSSQSVLALLK
jgi:flagellin